LSVEEREITALQRLGLTEYESRIYLVLVKMGPIKASELSFFGQIPRTKTYGAIKELERKGLLRIIPGKPEAYAPSSPSEVLMPLVTRLSRDLSEADGVVQSLMLAYESSRFVKRQGPKEAEEFWELEGRPSIINKLNQIFSDASKTINYCTTAAGLIRAYKAHCEILEKVSEKGTGVRILSTINSENTGVAKEISEVLDFKILDKPFGENFVTIDTHQLVVVETKPEDIRTDQGSDKAIWTTNRLLVDLHDQLFDRIWNSLPAPKLPSK
jgi:HTH-type transcriptional regulator, sugar sensing transcriptional regulator